MAHETFEALGHVIDSIRGKEAYEAELDQRLATKEAQLAELEAQEREVLTVTRALQVISTELEGRRKELMQQIGPEERDMRARVAELQDRVNSLQARLYPMEHQASLEEEAARARVRQAEGWRRPQLQEGPA
jgi:chromosome segregation ATPase